MGIFSKLANALKKTKKAFSDALGALFSKNKLGDEFYDELEEILISSDISVNTAADVVDELRAEVKAEKIKDKDFVVDCLKDILQEKLEEAPLPRIEYPAVIMLVGVNGVGKTTTVGKLAAYFLRQGKSVTVAAADTFRAAASDQLSVWADRAKVRIVKHEEGSDPSAVVFDALSSAKARGTDVVIVDTAGRLHVKSNLMEELKKMSRVVDREYPAANFYKLLVLDATTGNNAYNQAEVFDGAVELDGIVLTKLDGSAKGGFVISLCGELEIPVVFAGVGEKIDDLELFDPEEFIDNIKILINTLCYKVLEPFIQKVSNEDIIDSDLLYISIGSAMATGMITTEGFVVLKGSTINEKTSAKSLSAGMAKLRSKHMASNAVDGFVTVENILFSSASAAADFVLGYSVSGPRTWKTKEGRSLKEIEDNQSDTQIKPE